MPTLMLLFLLSLLTLLLPSAFGITLPHIYLSPTLPPNKPYFANKLFLEDARFVSTRASFAPMSAPHRHHFKPHLNPFRAPAPSPASQGLAAAPIASRVVGHHRHRHHRPRARVSPSPAVGSGLCRAICFCSFCYTLYLCVSNES